ncbi:hypothetical protein YC2023_060653 [Brassica napus]
MLGILLNKLASGITVKGSSNNQVPSAQRFLAGRTYGGSGGWALRFLSCSSSSSSPSLLRLNQVPPFPRLYIF